MRNELVNAHRIVVKVGTSSLTYSNGGLNLRALEQLTKVLSDIKNRGVEVVLVSSGAVGVGTGILGLKERPKTLRMKQAAAAVGQSILMDHYHTLFGKYGYKVGQVLLTREVADNAVTNANAQNTFNALLEMNVIPIVNENDTISTHEIGQMESFGDNDTLSAIVSVIIGADMLVIMSDIDGLYDKNPRTDPDAKLIKYVEKIDDNIRSVAEGAGSSFGTGGMATKINAAEIAMAGGAKMVIVNGKNPEILYNVFDGEEVGTLFGKENS